MSPVNSGVTEPNFTKLSHDIQASYATLSRLSPLINWKKATDPSSARNALSYGVKTVSYTHLTLPTIYSV